ncbi:RodZ family helix-turn-helix domain-containing protein [Pasteurellaceae bacterium LIM206]|nr:RodZ family helix-turn-helix domain-containing protein [Pasteurellaceae bacterium LIM206]
MNTETNPDQPSLSLGEIFRQSREKQNLSLEDVAKKLNIRAFIIQAIENNEFEHKSIPTTFIKGYVRNYAKLLKLHDDTWASTIANLNQTQKDQIITNELTKHRIASHASHSRWVTYLTAIVLLFVVGMTALWWWENFQLSSSERDNLVQNYVSNEEKSTTVENSGGTRELPVATTLPVSSATTDTVAVTPTTNESAAIQPVQFQPAENNLQNNTTQAMLIQHSAEPAPSAASDNTATAEQPVTANGDLVIEVTGSCWISVKDAKRKVLAQKEYKQGEVLTFNGEVPYSVIIGAPGNVKITYKGEDYPLKIDGRVAKFKLQ